VNTDAIQPTLAWTPSAEGHMPRILSMLRTVLSSLDRHPLQELRAGRAFRLMLDYDEDGTRPGHVLSAKGWFILRGGSTMLRIDLRPVWLASDLVSPIRIDEPCPPGRRVKPTVGSIRARVEGLIAAIEAPKPDPTVRRARMEAISTLLDAAYAACAGDGGRDGGYVRFPGPWESFPYIGSILRRDRTVDPPHFMFEDTRTGAVHPDLLAMMTSLPGPHGHLDVREKTHRRGSPSIHCTIRSDTHIRIAPPGTLDPLAVMRTLSAWNPADGLPPLQPEK
jgi:hypothetical protein